MPQEKRIVLVDGATGYLGSHLVHRLSQSGHHIRCLIRSSAKKEDVTCLQSTGAEIFFGSLQESSTELESAFENVACAVHLIGSIAPRRGERLGDLHAGQTETFVHQAKNKAVSKVIHVTALGTSEDADNTYHQTKWHAEQITQNSGMNYIILRPSLLIGRTAGQRDSKLVKRLRELILTKKAIPLVGGGRNLIQPLFIDDMVSALIMSINDEGKLMNNCFELGGPEVMSMRQFVLSLMQTLKLSKPIIDLNPALALGIAWGLELVQPAPIISRDQVKLSLKDNICPVNHLSSVFAITPQSVHLALQSYQTT